MLIVNLALLFSAPYQVGISSHVYSNLNDDVKYYNKETPWGTTEKVDMWEQMSFEYNGKYETYYHTSYHWTVG